VTSPRQRWFGASTGLGFLDQCRAELSWLATHPTEQT